MSQPLFHRAHYNILAAQIKKTLYKCDKEAKVGVIDFALSLVKRLKEDNSNFDPIDFLEKCSPDPEKYPIQELWNVE